MKTEAEVRHKLAQVRFRHLKRELRTHLSRKPSNCKHNGRVFLPVLGNVGICLAKTATSERQICDSGLDNQAPDCSLFECGRTKEELRTEFDDFLANSDRAHIAERFPDLVALLWVLDSGPEIEEPEESEEEKP